MKILLLAQFYPPVISGGEERHVQDLGRGLVQRGHQVVTATLWHEGTTVYENDEGVEVYRLPSTMQRADWLFSEPERRHAAPFPDPETTLALHRLIQREQPDVIHAHNWLLHAYLPLKKWHKIPFVVSLHDYSLRCAMKRNMFFGQQACDGPSLRKCMRCAGNHYGNVVGPLVALTNRATSFAERLAVDMFLPVSQAVATGNDLDKHKLSYQVIPNFLPDKRPLTQQTSEQADIAPYLDQLPSGDFLLFVGDLSRDKGVDVLINAYRSLENAPPLVLIGRPRPQLPLKLPPNVYQLNRWPHAAVLAAWQRSSIALVPSTWHEPFGIVAIEAMAAGRPIIASNIGGLANIITHQHSGLLVTPKDPLALRKAISRLLVDKALCERLGKAAQQQATDYHASHVIPRIEQIYESVTHNIVAPQQASKPLRIGNYQA